MKAERCRICGHLPACGWEPGDGTPVLCVDDCAGDGHDSCFELARTTIRPVSRPEDRLARYDEDDAA